MSEGRGSADANGMPFEEFDHNFRNRLLRHRYGHCVNCWHMSDQESDAMWKLYALAKSGIAIQSTVGGVNECLRPHDSGKFAALAALIAKPEQPLLASVVVVLNLELGDGSRPGSRIHQDTDDGVVSEANDVCAVDTVEECSGLFPGNFRRSPLDNARPPMPTSHAGPSPRHDLSGYALANRDSASVTLRPPALSFGNDPCQRPC